MERPKVNHEPTQRPLTGEVMYYNDMRRLNQMPGLYKDISDTAMQMYETEAAMYQDAGTRPDIMADYERFDDTAGEVVDSCIALTDELLAFRPEDDRFSFEDIAVELPADKVQDMLRELRAGALLADDDEQLAIESDGAYYRVLDAKKNQATPTGVGLRVWGWDDPKVVYTNKDDEPFDRFKHVLRYPSSEQTHRREVELRFGYEHPDAGTIVESVTLTLRSDDAASFHSSIWMSEYAETGYEGHHRRHLNDCSDDDIATYGDLIAMIVGDQPESESMKTVRTLDETIDSIATEQARSAVRHLIVSSWPAQALYILSLQVPDGGTILENLHDEARVQKGIDAIDTVLAAMQKRAR